MFKNILSHLYLLIYISVQIVLIKTQNCFDSRSRPGKCMPLARCPDIYEEFHEQNRMATYPIDFQAFISSSICGFDGVNQMICCRSHSLDKVIFPNSQMHSQDLSRLSTKMQRETTVIFAPLDDKPQTPVNNPKKPIKPIKPISRPTKTNKDTLIFLPIKPVQEIPFPPQEEHHQPVISATGNCGTNQIFISRIVGGSVAKRGNYPWIAALGYFEQGFLQYLCGGSLITSKHVLTCAHCINGGLSEIRLGAYDLSKKAEPNARNYRIRRIVVHERYDKGAIKNDIAIIELSEPVVMTRFINTICLPENPESLESISMNAFVAGWGSEWDEGPTTKILKDAQVSILNLETCARKYKEFVHFSQHGNKMFCARSGSGTSCYGDSGGPLMMPQLKGSRRRYYLIGLASFTYGCGRNGIPDGYTRVSAFLPWIKRNIS